MALICYQFEEIVQPKYLFHNVSWSFRPSETCGGLELTGKHGDGGMEGGRASNAFY